MNQLHLIVCAIHKDTLLTKKNIFQFTLSLFLFLYYSVFISKLVNKNSITHIYVYLRLFLRGPI